MKRFLLKIIYFILPIILLALPLDYFLSKYLKISNEPPGELEVMNDIYTGNIKSDLAIYGSSRAWVHFNPAILKDSLHHEAYNFGIDGHNFKMQYLRHLEYLKHNQKPKNIILSVDIFSLQKREDLYQLNQFLPYMLWNSNIKKYTESYKGFGSTDYVIPLWRFVGKLDAIKTSFKNFMNPSRTNLKYRTRGFAGMHKMWNDDFEKAAKEKKSYEVLIDTPTKNLLIKFIQECKQNSVGLVFVYAPEYIDGQKFVSNRAEILNVYDEMAKQYSIPYFNFSNDSLSFQKELFYNTGHMNFVGADLFTAKLSTQLKHTNYFK